MSEYVLTKDELYHHGIKGQKWGIRRFQNSDGSYTAEGKERYGFGQKVKTSISTGKEWVSLKLKDPKVKKAIKIGAAVAVTALAIYGGYKLSKFIKADKFAKTVFKAEKVKSAVSGAKFIAEGDYKNGRATSSNISSYRKNYSSLLKKGLNEKSELRKIRKRFSDRENKYRKDLIKYYKNRITNPYTRSSSKPTRYNYRDMNGQIYNKYKNMSIEEMRKLIEKEV